MRFMAILGLCLMVIFALVQSLPSVAVDRETQREQASDQAALATEVEELRAQVGILGSQTSASESDNDRLQEVVTQQEQLIEQLSTVVDESESAQAQLEQQVTNLTEELELARAQVGEPEPSAEVSPPGELKPVVETPEPIVAEEIEAQETETESETETETETEGFRLLFASDDAFFQQVSSGGIEVFVQSDSGGYRLNTESTQVTGSRLPESFQQMDRSSLPASLADVLTRAGIESSATWGVVLSSSLLTGINQARAGANSGLLVIEENGQVSLRP